MSSLSSLSLLPYRHLTPTPPPPSLSSLLSKGAREEGVAVDQAKARKEAAELYAAGEKKLGTDESKFNHILATRSYPQLLATFDEYTKVKKSPHIP